jgi:hypothetical protein
MEVVVGQHHNDCYVRWRVVPHLKNHRKIEKKGGIKYMNIKKSLAVLVVMMAITIVFAVPASAQNVEVQIGMALDRSGSIGQSNWNIIVTGVADAVNNSTCVPHDGTVELTVVTFPGGLQVGPVVITSANASAIANSIRVIPYIGGSTPMDAGITTTANAMSSSPHFDPAIKQVINIATDGMPDNQQAAVDARNAAITLLQMTATQDEIDAEAIGTGADVNWLRDNIVYPQPGTIAIDPPYTPGWVHEVADAQAFSDSVCEKFKQIMPVPSLTPLGIVALFGLVGIIAVRYVKRE